MILRRRQRRAVARYHALRGEVQRMPAAMAAAMLTGLDHQGIVTGQYTDGQGGACPLLAASRAGGPLAASTNFPRVWDRFCGLRHWRQARPASKHELRILRLLLEEHLMPAGERGKAEIPIQKPSMPHTPQIDWQRELAELVQRSRAAV